MLNRLLVHVHFYRYVIINNALKISPKRNDLQIKMIGTKADHLNLNCCYMNLRGHQDEPFRVSAKGRGVYMCVHT